MAPMDNSPQPMAEIITRFLEGEASEQEVEILKAWLKEDKANRQYFDELNTAFQAAVTLSRINQQKTDASWNQLSQRIGATQNEVNSQPSINRFQNFTWLKIAASVSIIALSIFLASRISIKEFISPQDISVGNTNGNSTRVVLPDGSTVWLNANSVMEYPASFGNSSRIVTLKGEAFFDVKKNGRPFIVNAGHVKIHVKGTRFNVQAYHNDRAIKTTLEEGKVELQLEGKDVLYVMKPGDQITLDKELNEVTLAKVDPTNFTAWKEEQLIFNNAPLIDIIAKLENRFRVNISADSALANRERLTMTIEDESLDEILELIQLSSHLEMKKENNEIILYQ